VPADRDFELTWKPVAEKAPSVGLFREHVGNADYLLAFVTPPSVEQAQQKSVPREVIFVIDNSGSMAGTSIAQAKASLVYALGRLQPSDRFNVIRFDHTMDVLFSASVPADAGHLGRATAFVSALEANGGTEMVPAMRAALTDDSGDDANNVRQVVFLTDGAIGNEQQLFETITAMRGRSRVFMVGIGSAPNTYLMTRAAELGRGAFTHIGSVDQVEERMRGLFSKLENPAVTGLTAKFSEASADITPAAIPDLYRDEPLVLAAKLDKLAGSVEIKGRIGDRPWVVTLPLANAAEGKGLSKLWARRKISDAEVARTTRQAAPEDADKTILALALEHQIVTRLTSLVAVDKTPSRPEGVPLKVSELPINLPAGWDFAKVFGERPQLPAVPRERRADAGDGKVQVASLKRPLPVAVPMPDTVKLPKTATDSELKMIAGSILLALSLILFLFNRRQMFAR
jgi:Ca-activated chloride channel homolog